MTHVDALLPLLEEYRVGMEAEIALLRQLTMLAGVEREITRDGALHALDELSDARERVMNALISLDAQLAPLRATLAAARETLRKAPGFAEVSALHQEAAALAAEVTAADADSLVALRDAELSRRFAAESLDKGESTLAAYRRVVAPVPAQASLVNRRG